MTTHQRHHGLTTACQSYVNCQFDWMSEWLDRIGHLVDYVIVTPHDYDGKAIYEATDKVCA